VVTTKELVKQALDYGAIQCPIELGQLIDFLRPKELHNCLEIGSESGGTFFLWCKLVYDLKISLDLPAGASGSGLYKDEHRRAWRNERMRSWSNQGEVACINGDSHHGYSRAIVMSLLAGQFLDLLFIDGDHSYAGVKQDYEMYGGFVRRGGLIIFHDIKDTPHHRRAGCFVADFWKELPGKKIEFCSDIHFGGIGIVEL
jgi:hypothetical protein